MTSSGGRCRDLMPHAPEKGTHTEGLMAEADSSRQSVSSRPRMLNPALGCFKKAAPPYFPYFFPVPFSTTSQTGESSHGYPAVSLSQYPASETPDWYPNPPYFPGCKHESRPAGPPGAMCQDPPLSNPDLGDAERPAKCTSRWDVVSYETRKLGYGRV